MAHGTARSEKSPWQQVDCLLCGGDRYSTVLQGPGGLVTETGQPVAVVRCQACGLCYTSPRPTPGAMARFYPTDYGPHRRRQIARPRRLSTLWRRMTDSHSPERDGVPWHGQGRLVDFGCGSGDFLWQMHQRGWRVIGVDVSKKVVTRIRDELKLTALQGDLSHGELADGSVDVVTMWQSLEHVHHPMETLRQAHRLLAPGGKLFAAVPNLDSLPVQWFGAAWYGFDLPRHLTHFTPSTLRAMLVGAGFEVERLWMVPHSSWLMRSARECRRLGGGPRFTRLLLWRPVCRLVTRYCAITRRSDCIMMEATK